MAGGHLDLESETCLGWRTSRTSGVLETPCSTCLFPIRSPKGHATLRTSATLRSHSLLPRSACGSAGTHVRATHARHTQSVALALLVPEGKSRENPSLAGRSFVCLTMIARPFKASSHEAAVVLSVQTSRQWPWRLVRLSLARSRRGWGGVEGVTPQKSNPALLPCGPSLGG